MYVSINSCQLTPSSIADGCRDSWSNPSVLRRYGSQLDEKGWGSIADNWSRIFLSQPWTYGTSTRSLRSIMERIRIIGFTILDF